ncbi:MAG TPA: Gfo/Idh/MocA family oxidoreductase [Bacteroidales bacterium]|nr:Gfo/Idh/MocA family oxidoreductase [Bacteroidales bacterium]
MSSNNGIGRRGMLKALAGVPVVGLLGVQALRKYNYEMENDVRRKIVKDLGLEDLLDSVKPVQASKGDLIRIGIIGTGVRGKQHLKALGFWSKDEMESTLKGSNKSNKAQLQTQMNYGNLNIAITGICDVFDPHAEEGLEYASNDIFTGGDLARQHGLKRYRTYHEMLADPNIDAVTIATPDHHHAKMAIDAVKAGKHVYAEKAVIHREDEIEPLYEAVKNSNVTFQQGHQYTQNSIFKQAKEIIDRGMLGDISHLETFTNRNGSWGAWIRHLDSNGNPKIGDPSMIDWQQWLGDAPYAPFSVKRLYSWARYFDYDTGLYGQLFSHEYDAFNQLLNIGIPDTVASSGGQYYYKEFGEIPDILHTTMEYPEKGFAFTYSGNLNSSSNRERAVYGKDAWMTVLGKLKLTPDKKSEKYADLLDDNSISPDRPMIEVTPGGNLDSPVDAIASATSAYYAERGLISTNIEGKEWDITHLHLKEWIDCIRNGGTPSSGIEKAYETGVTIAMADISYRENCITKWDPVNKKILRI